MNEKELQKLLALIESQLDKPNGIHYVHGYVKQTIETNKVMHKWQETDPYQSWDSNVNYTGYEGL